MPILLFVLWIILNGRITVEIVLFGLALDALVILALTRLTNYRLRYEPRLWRNVGLMCAYLAVLIWEILKANWKVLGIVLFRSRKIKPMLVKVSVPLSRDWQRMLLANSITLTPGTITAEVEGDVFTVHCLDEGIIDGIEDSRFVRLLRRMEA